MTDILLVQPPVEDFYFTYKRTIPYGLASIASSLQQHKFSVEILDSLAVKKSKIIQMPDEMNYLLPYYGEHDLSIFSLFHDFRHYGYSYEYIGKVVKDKKPFLVGISSLFTPYCNSAETTAQVVKKFLPDCKIVMGGHHPTALPHEVMKCSAVDFLIRGEAEISMPLLAARLKTGQSIEDVPGIVFRKKQLPIISSKSINSPDRLNTIASDRLNITEYREKYSDSLEESLHVSEPAWIKDFSLLSPPAMELVNFDFYSRGKDADITIVDENIAKSLSAKKGSTVVVASRGCPMPCTYCSVGASSSYGRFRQRAVKDVIHELELQVEKYNIGFIDFEDENLTLNRRWFLDLMAQILKLFGSRRVELRAMNGLYPPSLDPEIIAAMKSAGFKTLNLSLGSTSAEQLKRFKRPDVRDSFEKVLSIAESHGLETVSYLIAGAPDESAYDSLNDLISLAQKRTLIGLSIFYPAPGSVDYERCRQRGVLPESFSLMRSSSLPLDHTTSRLQSVTLLRLARVLNFMKSLVRDNKSIPEPEPYNSHAINHTAINESQLRDFDVNDRVSTDRNSAGINLLKWFLHDGILRGIRKDGSVFNHNVDLELCRRFVTKSMEIEIR